MEYIIGAVGAVLGLIIGYFAKSSSVSGAYQKEIEAANVKADLTLKEAEKTASRKLDDAKYLINFFGI